MLLLKDEIAILITRKIFNYSQQIIIFLSYHFYQISRVKGIYHRFNNSDSKELYGHCAKMIGWGNSNGTEYWLYMNTWGREWGDNGSVFIKFNKNFFSIRSLQKVSLAKFKL